MNYTISRSKITGKLNVHYECPGCDADLNSPLTDAGQTDECPECGDEFSVPGTKELKKHLADIAQAKLEKEQAERRQREAELQAEELEAKRKKEEQLQNARWKSAVKQMVISSGDLGMPFEIIGVVFGYSSSLDSDHVYETALENLKQNAAQLNADALIYVNFQNRSSTRSVFFGLFKQPLHEVFAWGTAVRITP